MSESESTPPESGPAPREFRFKPAEFERDNRPVDDADEAPIDVRDLYQKAVGTPIDPAGKPPPAENEVHDILRDNLARANERGEHDVVIEERRLSRRNRDYWFMLISGNLFFLLMIVLTRNIVSAVFAGAGIVFYSLALTWVMFFVMSDY